MSYRQPALRRFCSFPSPCIWMCVYVHAHVAMVVHTHTLMHIPSKERR